ncbi:MULTISPECIES: DUF1007 family protein [Glaesserella]|uniref:DUF1007 domain-containing protein n=1 Tax=Glaesserella australis TaxID=2094024 RepID=A0A328BZW8_9PAST|nr:MULTISPECIES: DUF1007 family protein [Glaesserella]AUI65404.1 ABC transporter substrate-binding protein [Glaesserella sp. 15-184]RAL19599.1 DUF1007 domain-containing protein [Glaesserella australis]
MLHRFFTVLFSILLSTSIFAHPHSFLDMKNKVLINQDKLDGFELSWMLDEITSAELIYEINSSQDKKQATAKILKELDDSAVGTHYFSELYNQQNQAVKFKGRPHKSSVEIKHNRIIYHFTLLLAEPQAVKGQSFRFFTFEPSYYLAMNYEKASDVSSTEQSLCKVEMIEPTVNQSLRLYASKLDKNETPDMPDNKGLSLGAQFAQKVSIVCQ